MDIYSILEKKSKSDQFKDRLLYYDLEINRSYSFNDVYNLVNEYIDMFSSLNIKGKKKYLIVDNSVDSVVMFIALLKCGAIPVLINKEDLQKRDSDITKYFNELDEKYNYEDQLNNLKYDYIIANDINTFENPKEELAKVTSYIDRIEQRNDDCDFYICTSGVTGGIGKLIPLKDKELIKRSLDCDKDYSILTTISISAISGIIYNVYRPIINNIQNYMSYRLFNNNDETRNLRNIAYYRINRVLLPLDVIDILNDELKNLDFSCLDRVYLTGGICDYNSINQLKKHLPNLDDNAITNMYGRTENYGMLCNCHGRNIKSLYINVLETNLNEIVYTYDKVHFYKDYIKNNQRVTEEITCNYDENCYANYLSVSNGVLNNINIDGNGVIGEIIADNEKTGDLGLYLNNQLYVLGRKNDLIAIDDKEYFLPLYEQMFNNITGLKTAAIVDEETNKLFVVVDYKINPVFFDNFKRMIPIAKKCNDIIDNYHLSIEYPLFVPSEFFPRNKLMRKTKKIELLSLVKNNSDFQEYINNYNDSFIKVIKNHILSKYGKNVTIVYQNNEFIFNKNEITFDELEYLEQDILGYIQFREDDNNFYFMIDDCVLFNKYPDISYVNPMWTENNIKFFNQQRQVMDRDSFSKYYNRHKDRGIHYSNMKLIGVIYLDDDYCVFKPYQLAGNNNYKAGVCKLAGEDLPFLKCEKGSFEMVYLESAENEYYSNDELQKKINQYLPLLNHLYKIRKADLEYFIDQNKMDKKDEIYDQLKDNPIIHHITFSPYSYMHNNDGSNLNKNNIILINDSNSVTKTLEHLSNYGLIEVYDAFKVYGLNIRIELTKEENLYFIINRIVRSSKFDKLDDIGLIIYPHVFKQFMLSDNPNMELFNESKKIAIRKMNELIEEIRNMGKKELFIEGRKIIVDFSKLKLVILDFDDDISNIDYIIDIIGDCNIIDYREKNKVLRKGVNNEYKFKSV